MYISVDGGIAVVDSANRVIARVGPSTAIPSNIAINSPDDTILFASNDNDVRGLPIVYAIDIASGNIMYNFTINSIYTNGVGSSLYMAYVSSNHCLYVADTNKKALFIFDTLNRTLLGSIPVGDGPAQMYYDQTANLLYVTVSGAYGGGPIGIATTLAVVDPATNKVAQDITVGGSPIGIARDSSNGLLYVTNYGNNSLSVVNPTTGNVTATIPLGPYPPRINSGPYPTGIDYDPHNNMIYVSNQYGLNNGTVSIINPTTGSVVQTLSVGKRPMAVLFNPANNEVYVAINIPGGLTLIPG
jgi:YVTN family beta-propeller protein